MSRRSRAGFTLIELMVVVAIAAVLAAISIPLFSRYVYQARAAEAHTFLAEIRSRQTAYRSERGRFCGNLDWNPATYGASGTLQAFNTADPAWAQLGAAPDGPTRFQYRVVAGGPADASGITGLDGDFWYYAQAQGDLDGDGVTMVVEAYSAQRQVFRSRGIGGPYLSEGYE